MKKCFLFLFAIVSMGAKAQKIDTVLVRNLQLQAQDWAWLIGKYSDLNEDSVTAYQTRRIRDKIRTVNPAAWTTNVTIDSLPGSIVLSMYKAVKLSPAGEIVARYTAITNAISGKTNMTYFTSAFDAILTTNFNRYRDRGKTIVMDN